MKHSILCLLLAVVCVVQTAGATGDSLYFLLPSDTVIVKSDPASGHLLFDHYLAPKQTLYGAARFYGLTLEDVYRLNPGLRTGYTPGTRVTVAIPRNVIRPKFSPDSIAWFVPVRYRMAPGETVYGLTRRVLGQPDDQLLRTLNPGLDPTQLSPGQVLKIGYLRLDGIQPDSQVVVEDPYLLRNRPLHDLWLSRTQGVTLRSTNGKASWTNQGDPNKWMVLHRTAPIGSLIEIEDPRSRKTVYARVVARIPEQVYDSRVVLVVSPLLVKAFGVRDREFYVRTRHL
ncbi:LysM peptidoglycan-binding domain-containing protein [Lewinella sp. JB7]|uniref:DPBB and LysM peptidoglycan-binding domain-containing protein n=1 Tax=Lewinella sp. JB7 TaxID=2962887 RepID=UPI0020CA0DCB|nr:LysM peptidoglycan-binding domain-containing protein [Lewinella sp. JB7]MCP9235405.1 LysM peptidoglycan-binding domain-containing protein [Lewinella sp. JB7]